MLRYYTLWCLCLLITCSAGAQDIHFSQFNMSPLTMNPALTGAFSGTFRIGGIYRDQYGPKLLSKQYSTPAVFVDAPVIKGFRNQDWVGVGGTMFQDKAGTLGLTNGAFLFSGAYHFAVDKKRKTVLTFGFQMGGGSRDIKNKDKARFEDEIISGTPSEDLDKIQENNASYTDYATGLLLTTRVNNKVSVQGGIAFGHLFRPRLSNFPGGDDRLGRRFTVHGTSVIGINDRFRVTPALQMQAIGKKNFETSLQGIAGYKVNPTKDFYVNAGLGYRVAESAQVHVGVDVKDLRVGFCYDMPTVAFRPTASFEIAATYIVKIFKKPNVKPVIFCPRF